jgi:hypothetical protein
MSKVDSCGLHVMMLRFVPATLSLAAMMLNLVRLKGPMRAVVLYGRQLKSEGSPNRKG